MSKKILTIIVSRKLESTILQRKKNTNYWYFCIHEFIKSIKNILSYYVTDSKLQLSNKNFNSFSNQKESNKLNILKIFFNENRNYK